MNELRSKCCGVRIYMSYDTDSSCTKPVINYRCSECHKPCGVEKKLGQIESHYVNQESKMLKGYPLIFTEDKELQEAREAEKEKVRLEEEWIKDKITELFVILNIFKPSSNDVRNAETFIRSLVRVQ